MSNRWILSWAGRSGKPPLPGMQSRVFLLRARGAARRLPSSTQGNAIGVSVLWMSHVPQWESVSIGMWGLPASGRETSEGFTSLVWWTRLDSPRQYLIQNRSGRRPFSPKGKCLFRFLRTAKWFRTRAVPFSMICVPCVQLPATTGADPCFASTPWVTPCGF